MTEPQNIASAPAPGDTLRPASACLVIHNDLVVAHDLRDILLALGAPQVVVRRPFTKDDMPPDPSVFIVFAAQPLQDVLALPAFARWRASHTPVVLLDSDADRASARRAGCHVLQAPFSTETVANLVADLGTF